MSLQLGRQQLVKLPDLLSVVVTFVAVSILKAPLAYVLIVIGTVSIWLYRPHPARAAAPEHLPFHRGIRHKQYRH